MVTIVPWALIVVPWGIEASRAKVDSRASGCSVGGTISHSPGSRWIGVVIVGSVTSLIDWR